MDKISTEKQNKKPGRKPIYVEERVKVSFRAEKSFADDLAKLIELYKQENPEMTQNDYIVNILNSYIYYDICRCRC